MRSDSRFIEKVVPEYGARIAVEIYPSDALHKLRVGGMVVVAAGKSAKVESKKKVKAPSDSEKQASGPTFLRISIH